MLMMMIYFIILGIRCFVGQPVLVKARITDDLPDVLG